MRRAEFLAGVVALAAGCAGPQYGVTFSSEDAAEAGGYPGVPSEASDAGMDIDVGDDLCFVCAGRPIATIGLPPGLICRVKWSTAQPMGGRAFYWASAQFQTPGQRKVEIDLKYFGQDALFLILDGRSQTIAPGAAFELAPDGNGFTLRPRSE